VTASGWPDENLSDMEPGTVASGGSQDADPDEKPEALWSEGSEVAVKTDGPCATLSIEG
jgi:hypothetical protein